MTKISRVWAMPNADTFTIKPIGEFVRKYLSSSSSSADPYARNTGLATYTNDLNPDTAAEFHLESEEFLTMLLNNKIGIDLVILDPPYSPRQIKECYDNIGLKMLQDTALRGKAMKRRRKLVNQIVPIGGVVLTFGWNTNGMGGDEWEIEEIILVAHGSDHNDTICMAERRIAQQEYLL